MIKNGMSLANIPVKYLPLLLDGRILPKDDKVNPVIKIIIDRFILGKKNVAKKP